MDWTRIAAERCSHRQENLVLLHQVERHSGWWWAWKWPETGKKVLLLRATEKKIQEKPGLCWWQLLKSENKIKDLNSNTERSLITNPPCLSITRAFTDPHHYTHLLALTSWAPNLIPHAPNQSPYIHILSLTVRTSPSMPPSPSHHRPVLAQAVTVRCYSVSGLNDRNWFSWFWS